MIENGGNDWNAGLEKSCFYGAMEMAKFMIQHGAGRYRSIIPYPALHVPMFDRMNRETRKRMLTVEAIKTSITQRNVTVWLVLVEAFPAALIRKILREFVSPATG